jgi:NDP-sugar pyrophosphorylase family protein
MTLPVAILAGGLATRLGALTRDIPKSLIEICGEPFAVRQIRLLRRHGFREIVFCLGHLGEQVQEFLGDGSRWSVKISYSFDGPGQLGTGGALKKAIPLLGKGFAVLYGDSYLECDYRSIVEAFAASGKRGLMTVFRNEGSWDTSNVVFREGRIIVYDKGSQTLEMRHIDYGVGLFHSSVFDAYAANEAFDLATVYRDLLAKDQLAAFETTQRFYEVGSLLGLEETRKYFQAKEPCQ